MNKELKKQAAQQEFTDRVRVVLASDDLCRRLAGAPQARHKRQAQLLCHFKASDGKGLRTKCTPEEWEVIRIQMYEQFPRTAELDIDRILADSRRG